VRARVVSARSRQRDRYAVQGLRTNAELTPALMARHCAVDPAGIRLLEAAARRLTLSARGYDRIQKVARTIADLNGAESISGDHIAEALQFRMT
jgi:magnesium chelatase family protein